MDGIKHDAGKPRWSLLPESVIPEVLRVLEHGAQKYPAPDNWKRVSDPQRRYYDAAMRHLQAWLEEEHDDPESGRPHLAHAITCLMFLLWFDIHD